jgi:hypothetical protein
MESMASFAAFHSGLGLTNFSADELLTKTDRPSNRVPPEGIWDHIGPTILVLQRLRTAFGSAIDLNSVYRAHEYNRHIADAARLSQHVAFNAIDFTIADKSRLPALHASLIALRDQWIAAPRRFGRVSVSVKGDAIGHSPLPWRASNGRDEFQFCGGVKLYNTFIHVDTRGVNGSWG